jgi:ABC-2 type transport system permease protein
MSPSRFTRLCAQEWRLFVAQRSNLVLLVVLAALLGYAVNSGVERVMETRSVQAEARDVSERGWAELRTQFVDIVEGRRERQPFDDATRADLVLMRHVNALALDPTPLALLSVGPAREGHDIIGIGIRARGAAGEARRENPAIRLDGPLDAAFVLTWLLPLMLIVLSYDALSRDREQQVAPMLAAQGVPLGMIVLVRLLVRFTAVLAVVAVIVGTGVAVVANGDLARAVLDLSMWLAAVAAFIAFWLALAACINARSRSSASAGLTLLGLWIVFSLLVPIVAAQVLSGAGATPDRLDSVLGRRALESDLTERAKEVTEAYYAEHPSRRPRAPAVNEYERYIVEQYYPRQVALDARLEPVTQRLGQLRVAQAERLRMAAMLSPTLAMKLFTDDVAGHAPERWQRFDAATADFQARWRARYDVKIASRTPLRADDYDDRPVFAYRDQRSSDLVVRHRVPATGLLLALFLAAFAAYLRFRRAGP